MAFSLLSCYAFPMQITVDIPDEFAAQIKASGLTAEGYVRGLIDDAVRTGSTRSEPAAAMDVNTFLRAMAENCDKMPVLPDEAFTRESFYQDHD